TLTESGARGVDVLHPLRPPGHSDQTATLGADMNDAVGDGAGETALRQEIATRKKIARPWPIPATAHAYPRR
ncbi:hypothetical protein L2249_17125, partial [Xanthomonas perforans]|uniref:hypothetical protein n=1 Tax=Xanthomonas perforans TaxID=442694 RepID=UPI001F380AD5